MKKIISVLILIAAVMMLSSCVWVFNPDESTTNYYDITCYNSSKTKITDWCVVRNGRRTYAKSENDFCEISPGGRATLYNLPEGTYVLYVAFVPNPDDKDNDYKPTTEFTLNEDMNISIDDLFIKKYYK